MMTAPGMRDSALLSALLSGENFWPSEPRNFEELDLSNEYLESLASKLLFTRGECSGHRVASELCIPFAVVESVLGRLRSRQLVTHCGAGHLNDYVYRLTEEGRHRAATLHQDCAYTGPAPVSLMDYVLSVEAQVISNEPIRQRELVDAFHDVSVTQELLDLLGPAANSASGMFLYGSSGNGKSTLAHRITSCFGQDIWIPHAILDGRDIITVFDPAYHRRTDTEGDAGLRSFDRRWVRVRRPTVVVGGELRMENLEIQHDPNSNISEAPLQIKSNCGCLLIDDFGRQRITPEDLLNRWIVPLESRLDYLTLASGKKIEVPFEQLIIFSTNLEPADLVDEAFLRRIPYRIEICDPDEDEFRYLFELAALRAGCEFDGDAVEHLLAHYYRPLNRPLRRCHARDILNQIRNFCAYREVPFEMKVEFVDQVADSFFTRTLPSSKAALNAPIH